MLKLFTKGTAAALSQLTTDLKLITKAISEGINETAKEVQTQARTLVAKKFTLRSPQSSKFLLRQAAIIRPFATPAKPEATIAVGNADRLLLSSFEDGGTQQPNPGRKARAVPIAARPSPNRRITRSKLISNLKLKKTGAGAGAEGAGGVFTTPRGIFERKRGKIQMLYAFKAATPIRRMLGWRAAAKATAAGKIEGHARAYLLKRLAARKNRTP